MSVKSEIEKIIDKINELLIDTQNLKIINRFLLLRIEALEKSELERQAHEVTK